MSSLYRTVPVQGTVPYRLVPSSQAKNKSKNNGVRILMKEKKFSEIFLIYFNVRPE